MEVLELLRLMGPGTGAPVLWPLLRNGGIGKRELEDMVKRYKTLARKTARRELCRLLWTEPGSVWAADHAELPRRIGGRDALVLAVRDLASGSELHWRRMADRSAESTQSELENLFTEHGPPLVIKWDNGGAFNAKETDEMLERWGVKKLLSPPYRPQYNGSCEASVGSMRRRTDHLAAVQGRPGKWMSDDLEWARQLANFTARPWGSGGPTPKAVWEQREAISVEERKSFNRLVARFREHFSISCDGQQKSSIERKAIRSALIECGYLQIKRRRISPLLKSLLGTKIT